MMEELLNRVHHMDCIEFMRKLPDDSVDTIATDPPYGLEFMQSAFDKIGVRSVMQQWHYDWAVEAFRVLKPGAHLLAFSGTRTYHRLACAIEDAGFEVRNMIVWIMGSGFPKGLNVSFGIMQKQLYKWLEDYPKKREKLRSYKGTERRQYMIELMVEAGIGIMSTPRNPQYDGAIRKHIGGNLDIYGKLDKIPLEGGKLSILLPNTSEAKEWYGFNTQLKPAIEPIVFARKPISEKSIVDNVLIHGTAAINIDACRIAVNPDVDAIGKTTTRTDRKKAEVFSEDSCGFDQAGNPVAGVLPTGRYPANLILSHHPDCKMIQVGTTKVKDVSTHAQSQKLGKHGIYGDYEVPLNTRHSFDVTKPEVWECVEGCPVRILNEQSGVRKRGGHWSRGHLYGFGQYIGNGGYDYYGVGPKDSSEHGAARFFYCAKPSVAERNAGMNGSRNIHITVKPLAIMRWLVKLATRRGGVVLDPFLGSGTTAIAAENEGCDWLACDSNEEYCRIAEARINALGGTQMMLEDFKEEEKK